MSEEKLEKWTDGGVHGRLAINYDTSRHFFNKSQGKQMNDETKIYVPEIGLETLKIIGTCSLCGGAVEQPVSHGGHTKCHDCGAVPVSEYGPTINMKMPL